MDRRTFLKLMTGLSSSVVLGMKQPAMRSGDFAGRSDAPNVLIVLFDAFSAKHASLYGYTRRTTPNLARFAETATVYHRHYSAGNFTNPGTASLLTGTYPWTHRTFQLRDSVARGFQNKSIFKPFAAGGYYTVGYSHNLQVAILLHDFRKQLDVFMGTRELCLLDDQLSDRLFVDDYNMAVWRERLFKGAGGLLSRPTSSLFLHLSRRIWLAQMDRLQREREDIFPRGLPNLFGQTFLLEDAIDWLINNLQRTPRPFLVYFHLLPPHNPYNARSDFIGLFDDRWQPPSKPALVFSKGYSDEDLNERRRQYDEYVAYVDAEFGRLHRTLGENGLLDDTYLVVTSDHGEMFERGIWEHLTPTLYEPIIHVPLLISRPAQRQRRDVHVPTSSVDLLPTLCSATGQPVPEWCEGKALDNPITDERSIYAVEAKENRKQGPLIKGTVALIKGQHKLIHYFGYAGCEDTYELYDVVDDPDEMKDLYPLAGAIARQLRDELQAKIREVNEPYL